MVNHRSGIKIIFIIIGSFILNKIIVRFIEKAVRITVRPDGISSKKQRKKRATLIQIFNTTANICILIH
jgi:small conductance mechanosensitive channel